MAKRVRHIAVGEPSAIRADLKKLLKASNLRRADIAEQMSTATGAEVTERMLNAFVAESREDHRWPAEFDIALCHVLNNYSLLANRVRRAGFRMIGPEEERLIEIGKAFVAQKNAQKVLRGVKL